MSESTGSVLVTGGAGYIGSHMVNLLVSTGHKVVVVDNISTGHEDAVTGAEFVQGDLFDQTLLNQVFQQHDITAVMHFAASIQVGESVTKPAKYYRNNLVNTVNLLDAMLEYDVKTLIFSSTAAVYGEPDYVPVDEKHPKNALNSYGCSKTMVEHILQDYAKAYDMKAVALRYFNAAGANPTANLGPRYPKLTHLILLVLDVALGNRDAIHIFGDDYDTKDGTCVRDYVHVLDLCQAHLLALQKLSQGERLEPAYNLGSGNGHSVKEIIEVARKVTGHAIPAVLAPRRPGDSAKLIADSTLAREQLGWQPEYGDLETIIRDTWQFVQAKAR